ncbi:tRNA glutamyl-Q(34) synthetase GluQRS [Rubritalea tangerina]|uniref:tRNA glutamyl-Q(34) synthetase GluQRS n=1 Tax=Rubritalea tangerina TaxID=430798 RepID=A0ABW4ZGV6_9BACT
MAKKQAEVITRFAPSPTGQLHLGHLYAALFARDLARKKGGRFLLRFEDIDTTRVRPHYYSEIESDLHHAGIRWDAPPLRQTTRFPAYQEALNKLKKLDAVYPCFCTRRDIQREIKNLVRAPHGPDGPLYPSTCKALTPQQIEAHLANGHEPAWRLDSERAAKLTGPLTFQDSFLGSVEVNHALLGDIILARKDIGTSYHIAVVVDDAFQNVTDVTRGKDLLESTHIHRILQALFELPEPKYHHHELVCDSKGERLAKRNAAHSLQSLVASGLTPEELIQLAQDSLA